MDARKPSSRTLKTKEKRGALSSSRRPKGKPGGKFTFFSRIRKVFQYGSLLALFLIPYYGWSSGFISRVAAQTEAYGHQFVASLGFGIQDIIVEGRVLTSREEILTLLKVKRGDSLFLNSLFETKKALESLPWIRSVSLQRRVPDTLYVRLSEYAPIALWQHEGQLYLVDDQGSVLENAPDYPQAGLLVLTGEGAPKKAKELIQILADFPDITQKVTGAIYIGNRRWDLLINHKLRLKLSESSLKESLAFFSKLDREHKLENKDITGVDLRFKDRVYFQLSPEALERKKKTTGKNA